MPTRLGLEHVHLCGRDGRFTLTDQATQRLIQQGRSLADVRHALTWARSCVEAHDGVWDVTGPELDGGTLSIVVAVTPSGEIVVL